MLETSRDVLNYLMGFSILLVAVLFSYVLYQMARAMKGVNDTIKVVQRIAQTIDETITTFKSKVGDVATYMTVLAKGGKQVFDIIQSKRSNKKKNSSKK